MFAGRNGCLELEKYALNLHLGTSCDYYFLNCDQLLEFEPDASTVQPV